jgi:hypothetical protein
VPPKPRTKSSTPKLSEVARHVVYPKATIKSSGWPKVRAQCAEMGITFDAWQEGVGTLALGKRADGKYAATVGGIVLSIPRQVGKTFLVGAIIIALCVLFPGLTVLWTAHRTRTATKTFQSMQGMVKRKKIWPHIAPGGVRTTNGEQEIRFSNGSVIMFGAREQGFGRGFDEVDVEVFDEAQILTEKALEDMVPAANQARHPSGALLFFMGTPPRPVDPGEEFSNRRSKALSGKAGNMVYVEFSADEDADPDDRDQWAKANPSFPSRTPVESMERMRENLTDDASFLREALGIWDAKGGTAVIDADSWARVADPASMAIENLALAIDVAPDRSVGAVSLAGQRHDGLWHVELDDHRKGTDWIIPWVVARCERNNIRAVVVDAMSPAASLIEELERAKIKVTTTSARDMAAACGQIFDGVVQESLRHTDQPQVNVSLSSASKRDMPGGGWAWNRRGDASDISPIVSVTLALWGARTNNAKTPTRKRTGGRRVVTG